MIDGSVIAAAIPAVVTFLVGMAVSRHLVSKATLSNLLTYATWAVQAEEEIARTLPKSGQQKLEAAKARVIKRTGVSEAEAETVILATVASLRRGGLLGAQTGKGIYGLIPNRPDAS